VPEVDVSEREGLFFLAYFAVYLGYLFVYQEGELLHWLTLVGLPLALILLYRRSSQPGPSLRASLASVGLAKGNLRSGILWGLLVGLAISALQVLVSQYKTEIWPLITSGRALFIFPIALLLMLLTAGFTEEFLFRGVLLTRLSRLFRSNVVAVLVSAALFGVYHLPYAYLNPNWPSHGDWGAAWGSAMFQGGVMGLVLGALYIKSRGNLLATVVLHSMVNSLPVMAQLAQAVPS
jgi:membrane protease YdiL (CAAX protease family)